ncbi:hypothetical protein NY08_2523 [Rhodococcus sp. B7740]|nr:hypothetical protein NY08_2523 [Rhodococcus sp. B7740]
MLEKCISTIFRVSVVAFLLGGLAIVVLQGGGLVAGDGEFVTHIEELLAPWAYGSAGIAGLLAFALSYFHRTDDESSAVEDSARTVTSGHA